MHDPIRHLAKYAIVVTIVSIQLSIAFYFGARERFHFFDIFQVTFLRVGLAMFVYSICRDSHGFSVGRSWSHSLWWTGGIFAFNQMLQYGFDLGEMGFAMAFSMLIALVTLIFAYVVFEFFPRRRR